MTIFLLTFWKERGQHWMFAVLDQEIGQPQMLERLIGLAKIQRGVGLVAEVMANPIEEKFSLDWITFSSI